jgi:peptidoglycan/xylan/chitin deacetylase (PgdA/CDA1 family)
VRAAPIGLRLLLLLVLLLGPAAPSSASVAVSPDEVLRGDPTRPDLALVFNVGAGFEPGTSILDTLADHGYAQATFFVMGWWAERHPDSLARIAADGHEIASHGYSDFDLTQVSDYAVRTDLLNADAAISAVTGQTTRPLWSPSGGYRDRRVRAIAADLGYRPILWTVDSGDWTQQATPESVYSHVINGAENGAIIVMHFDSPRTTTSTALVLPRLLEDLRAAGYRLVNVTELLSEAN